MINEVVYNNKYTIDGICTMKLSAKHLDIENHLFRLLDYLYTITTNEVGNKSNLICCIISSLRESGKAYRYLQGQSPCEPTEEIKSLIMH